ncbi:MAG: methyltransferase domain-containing protein, partial [Desulfobacterales bacterium]
MSPSAPARPPGSPADWARRWAETRRANPALQSQRRRPSRWRRFYDECGALLEAVRGFSPATGRTAAAALVRAAGLGPGDRVVDLGCGRGWLAAALAARGLRVLAVDESRPAVTAVQDRARRAGLCRLQARWASWLALSTGRPADLALAAFFPNVWTPRGFRRLERLGRRCAVLWGEGV